MGLFFLSNSIFSQDFQLASNNKTIICDNASVGSSGVVNGKTFTKVNRNTLVSMISNGDDVSCVCTSGITNMQGLFQNNQNFNQDISSWDTSSVSNMQGLFQNAGSFNQDIGYWDVSSMNDQNGVNQLFDNAGSLNQDLSYWCFPNNQNIYNNRNNIWGNNNPIKNNSSLRPRFSGRSPACRDPKIAPDQNVKGTVITWGNSNYGGNSSSVAADIDSGVTEIFSTKGAFAALKIDGSVVTWGYSSYGGDSSSVASSLSSGVTEIFSTDRAFAALKSDGSVVTWGDEEYGGDSSSSGSGYNEATANSLNSGVIKIFSTFKAFAALKSNGSVVTWGSSSYGGDSSSVSLSSGVTEIFSNQYSFAALKSNGSVVTWGSSSYGGDSSSVAFSLNSGVIKIFSAPSAFAALKSDGSVVTWGYSNFGGNSSSVASSLSSGVTEIFSTDRAFAAIKSDGRVVTWGQSNYGGDSSSVASSLSSGVTEIFSNDWAFAALKSDGTVVTWGQSAWGGDSSSASGLNSGAEVIEISSTQRAFAALKSDGTVVTWGKSDEGGDSSSSCGSFCNPLPANSLTGVIEIYSLTNSFAALKSNGSVVTWGKNYGGDSSSVASSLSSGVTEIFSNDYSFAALKGFSQVTLTITSNDSDNVITSGQVTLTATFSANMNATPMISISGLVTNVSMTQGSSAAVWTYYWQVPSNISSGTTVNVTTTATDTNNIAYSGNASLTLTISPTFYLASNGVTIKCSGCSAGDTGMVSGVLYTAHDNTSLANKQRTDTDWDRVVTTLVTDMSNLFGLESSFSNQNRSFNQNISSWDTSNVTNMSGMFRNNVAYWSSADRNFNSWDTSKVTDMSDMFLDVENMDPLIASWDVSSVTDMESMFKNCRLINQAIGSWDVSSVTNMRLMFNGTDYFNQDIGSWNTSSVTDMQGMFYYALEFNQNIGGWNVSNVTVMSSMFSSARKFNQDLNSWDVSKVTNMDGMFNTASVFNGNISSWDTSSVLSMSSTFESASRFNQDIGNWNVSNVTNMSRMFTSASDFVQDISGWCVSRINNEPSNFINSAGTNSWRADTSKHPEWGVCNSNVSVTLTDTDADNLLASSDTVTITATFTEAMTATPTISITGVVTNVLMNKTSGASNTQLGADIDGKAAGDLFGYSVSLSSDGSRLAIGGDLDMVNLFTATPSGSKSTGYVRVYDYNGSAWAQVGGDINAETTYDYLGASVSLSSDGSKLAIGAPGYDGNSNYSVVGNVRIFQYQVISGTATWTQLGPSIVGEAGGDTSGWDVSLSSDGSRVAIAAHNNDGNGNNSGHVRVFEYQVISGTATWTQLGPDIDGEAEEDIFGIGISLSSDGSIVAIGASGNDVNGNNSGHVRIFQYQVISGTATWTQLGQDIDGEAAEDRSSRLSLSSDGSRVAIGAVANDGNGSDSGHVRIYDFNGSAWVQVGEDIDGEAADDRSGRSVSLSSDGSRVAIGAVANDGNGSDSGHVRIYDFNGSEWVQVGVDIDGEAAGDNSGYSVSLSSDGSRVAIGAINNDGANGADSGHVRIYSISSGESYQYAWDVDSGSTPPSGTYYATVSATTIATGGAYSGTESITFTLDTSLPTVTLTDTDSDNLVNVSQVVTITAGFSKVMTATPTISITGIVTSVIMTPVSGTNSYTYAWDTSSGTLSEGPYSATVSGTDLIGNALAGIDSITFTIISSFSLPDYLPTNGLMGWYPFNGNAYDESGNENHGTVNGSVLSDDANAIQNSNSYAFDGQDDFISIGNSSSLNPSGALTFSSWFNLDDLSNNNNTIIGRNTNNSSADGYGYNFGILNDSNGVSSKLRLGIGQQSDGSISDVDHITSITANNWNHYAVTYDQSNVRVYLNGVKVHTAALTRSGGNHQNNFETFIGKYRPQSSGSEQSNQLFRGKLDNIGLWNRALTDVEITQLFALQIDTTTPTVTIITNDSDNTIKPGDNITVTVTFNEPMASGPRITIGSAVSNASLTATSSTTFTYSWNTSGVSAGSYTVTVTGTDLAGNTYAGNDSIKITLDSTAPTVILTDTDDDNFLATSDTVTITASFSEAMTSTPTISIANTSISNEVMTKIIGGIGTGSTSLLGSELVGVPNSGNKEIRFGKSISMSSDGSIVAIGAPRQNSGYDYGEVKVYRFQSGAWVPLGQTISGRDYYQYIHVSAGQSVSLSSDGTRLAVGFTGVNSVYIFDLNNNNQWTLVGGIIEGDNPDGDGTAFGHSVSMSSDGTRVAIGAPKHNKVRNSNNTLFLYGGQVRIYEYQEISGTATWTQLGTDINGGTRDVSGGSYSDKTGSSVSLSGDGSKVAILSPGREGGYIANGKRPTVEVFEYTPSGVSSWTKLGQDLEGNGGESIESQAVYLSYDGSRLVSGGLNRVNIYDYTPSAVTSWTQVGPIIGDPGQQYVANTADHIGFSVSISSDGSRIATGGISSFSGGAVEIWQSKIISGTTTWTQIGPDILADGSGDQFGFAASLSGDGTTVGISGLKYDASSYTQHWNQPNEGHVRIYSITESEAYEYLWDVDSGGAPSDGTYAVTVAGADKAGNAYSGTESITFTLDTSAPTVALTDTDDDNLVSTSEVVTITAGFSEAMTATPTISITGIVTNVTMGLVDYTVTDPVVFNVTVANSGGNKYFIDGQSQLSLVLVPGQTYRFDQSDSSNAGHPISFSTTNDGTHNSGSPYTSNVSSVGTPGQSGAYTLITIPSNGPSKLYYYCTNHSSMGGDITKGIGYFYRWDTSSGTLTEGIYTAHSKRYRLIGNAYAGTDSITFTVDTSIPTVSCNITTNDPDNTIKPGDNITVTINL